MKFAASLVALLAMIFLNSFAEAQTKAKPAKKTEEETLQRSVVDLLERARKHLDSFTFECQDCDAYAAGRSTINDESDPKKVCANAWAKFYERPQVDIRIALGFIDAENKKTSQDYVFRAALIEQLTASCNRNKKADPVCAVDAKDSNPQDCLSMVRACDFKRDPQNENILTKQIQTPDRRIKTVRVHLIASTESGLPNATLSERAERAYHDSLKSPGAVFYIGHARKGKGPSFTPAPRRKNGSIDYDKLGMDRKEYDAMLAALSSSTSQADIVGIFACDAEHLFETGLKRSASKSGLILATARDTERSLLIKAYSAIDAILWMKCEAPFNEALNRLKTLPADPGEVDEVHPVFFRGFFDSYKPSP